MPMPSQNLRMMQGGGDFWRSLVWLQTQSMSIRLDLSGVYPVKVWMSPGLADFKTSLNPCSSVWLPSGWKRFPNTQLEILVFYLVVSAASQPNHTSMPENGLDLSFLCPPDSYQQQDFTFSSPGWTNQPSALMRFSHVRYSSFLTTLVTLLPWTHTSMSIFLLVLGSSILNTVLQIQPHKCQIQGKNPFPCPGGCTLIFASQEADGRFYWEATLLTLVQLVVLQGLQALQCKATFSGSWTPASPVARVITFHTQVFVSALNFMRLH